MCKNLPIHDFTNLCHHYIFFLCFSKPALSMLEWVDRLILSRNVSRVSGGVHGHQAIITSFSLCLWYIVELSTVVSKSRHFLPTQHVQKSHVSADHCASHRRWLLRTYQSGNMWPVLYSHEGTPQDASCNPYSFSILSPAPGPALGMVVLVILLLGCCFIRIYRGLV